ncbi:MAG: N-acetylmuramoyl-L-alanine amidase [Clostridia bacterium]|nr:N-acetylmuramoyl-L-alanine amidase [Clostridia bacterium]
MRVKRKARTVKAPEPPRWPYILLVSVTVVSFLLLGVFSYLDRITPENKTPETEPSATAEAPELNVPDFVTVDLIAVDGDSRRGEKLEAVRDIAVHYVANPGTGAKANRNYFDSPDSETSSHFIVGLEGEVILCVPLDEKSSATNERNRDTISVEVCHPDETGEFSSVTYESLVRLLAWLCDTYELSEENLIRHYDVTGKLCPLYYVEHPEAWEKLKQDVKDRLNTEI